MDLTALLTLKDALEGAKKNTDRMIFKLNQFETRLSVLDENMSEIQVTTERYIKAKDNISLTLLEMEKTYEYFRVANEVKEIIHQGLLPSNQKEYLQAAIKLSQAKQFFETHREIKSSSSVLISIESLIQVIWKLSL
jgi:cysteinyl-tRNA synthetase